MSFIRYDIALQDKIRKGYGTIYTLSVKNYYTERHIRYEQMKLSWIVIQLVKILVEKVSSLSKWFRNESFIGMIMMIIRKAQSQLYFMSNVWSPKSIGQRKISFVTVFFE